MSMKAIAVFAVVLLISTCCSADLGEQLRAAAVQHLSMPCMVVDRMLLLLNK
jgi:hypothetical protein